MSERQEGDKDGSANVGELVVGKVNGVKLVQLGKRLLGNVLNQIVADVQNLDAFLTRHRHLAHRPQKVVIEPPFCRVARLVKS